MRELMSFLIIFLQVIALLLLFTQISLACNFFFFNFPTFNPVACLSPLFAI